MIEKTALGGIRVLELSGLSGAYCGKLFADLGADVTLIEPQEGSPLRSKPPFVGDQVGPENSIPFTYYASNKSSAVLDLATPAGQAMLVTLAASASLVILADHPQAGHVDLQKMRDANPQLVCTHITPYGSSGPYAGMMGDDLSLMAMGGLMTLAGFPDAPPVVAHGEQGLLAGDQFAAIASLAAVLAAERTGNGELIDISIQESVVMALENAAQMYQLEGKVRARSADLRRAGSGIFPCADGDIYLLAGGIGETSMWGNFADWMTAEDIENADIFRSNDWDDMASDAVAVFNATFLPYASDKTKQELYQCGKKWRVPLAPMSTTKDLLDNKQLQHREFFVAAPAGNPAEGCLMPGAPYTLSATPWSMRQAAPRLETQAPEQADRRSVG